MSSMRYILVMAITFISIFLLGCTGSVDIDIHGEEQEFEVSMLDAVHDDVMSDEGKMLERLNFTLKNNEPFDLDCAVLLSIENSTNSTSKRLRVGLMHPKESKRVSLKFEMFKGHSDLKVIPSCSRP